MYNTHPLLEVKSTGKKCGLYTGKDGRHSIQYPKNKTTKDELEEVNGRIESEIKQHIIVMRDMNCKSGDLIGGN